MWYKAQLKDKKVEVDIFDFRRNRRIRSNC
jgi:hypothetical protein